MMKFIVDNFYRSFLKSKLTHKFLEKVSLFLALNRLHKKSQIPQKKTIISEKIQGYKIYAYRHSTLFYLVNEIFIAGEYSFQTTLKKPLIIDCGANIGISVLYFKKILPKCRIMAFEPNPYSFKLLTQNIRANNITGVETYEAALYSEEKAIPFFISEDMGTPSVSIRSDRGGKRMLEVQTMRLSTFLKELDSVDLVKMDVEGAESLIVKDLVETSTISKVKNHYIEYHHNLKTDKSSLSSFLKDFENNRYSYKIRGSFRNQKGRRFQNIFFHFFREK